MPHGNEAPMTRSDQHRTTRPLSALAAAVLSAALLVPVVAAPQAEAATLPSGLQTGFALDGTKQSQSPPTTFNWDDFLTDVGSDGSFTFTPTPSYVTPQGYVSTGVQQGAFFWDNGSAGGACESITTDATGSPGSQTPNTNPWVTGPKNVNDKGNLCSGAYASETVTDDAGVRHTILYAYWTRRTGNGSVSVYDLFEGPEPGRCDDLLLRVDYPGGAAGFQSWTPAAGDGCADPAGAGTWVDSQRSIDLSIATGRRTEGPIVANQQQETFGEYAIDLTTAGLFSDETCSTFTVAESFTRTGNSPNASIEDFMVNTPDPIRISNCGTLSVTKATMPAGATDDEFAFTVRNADGPIQPGPPAVAEIEGSLSAGETVVYEGVIAGTRNTLTEAATEPWELSSITCTVQDAAGGTRTVDVTDGAPFPVVAGGRTDCVISNEAALVTVTKQTEPDGSDADFAFAVGAESASLSDGESATFAVPTGAPLTVTEQESAGWMPPAISCTAPFDPAGATGAVIVPTLGERIECTFTNRQLGTVVVSKEAHGVDGRSFAFQSDIPGGEAFSIEVPLGDGTLYRHTITDVPPGTYSLRELVDDGDPGTVLADLACTYGGSDHSADPEGRQIDLTVLPGETVQCFFTNTVTGSISILKRTLPVEFAQTFDFTLTGPGGQSEDFVLNGASDGEPAGALRSFVGLGAGTYTVAETSEVPGWSAANLECNAPFATPAEDRRSVTIDLPEGGVIVCFFTNEAQPATATLVKTVAGVAAGWDWSFPVHLSPGPTQDASGSGPGSDSVTWESLVPGQRYTISETVANGWSATPITCTDAEGAITDLDPSPGAFAFEAQVAQSLTCAVTNTAPSSSLQLDKITAGIGADYAWDFDMTISPEPAGETGTKLVSGVGQSSDGVGWSQLVPGQTYTITEGRLPAAVAQTFRCDGSDITPVPGGFQFTAPLGGSVACVMTNIADPSTATITKTTDGGDGAFRFRLHRVDGADPDVDLELTTTAGTGSAAFGELVPGIRYGISEVDAPGWSADPLVCTLTPEGGPPRPVEDVSDFVPLVGDAISCEARNTLVPGSISFAKTVAGVVEDFPWTFPVTLTDADGEVLRREVSGVGPGADAVSWDDLPPGRYTLAEVSPVGWVAGAIDCGLPDADAEQPGVQLDLAAGGAFACAATNTAAPGAVDVVKRVSGVAEGVPWSFTVSIDPVPEGGPASAVLSGTGPGLGAAPVTWDGLAPGAVYTLTETGAAGWSGSFSCDDGRLRDEHGISGFQFIARPGGGLVCIADNEAEPGGGVLTKTVEGRDGTFEFVLDTVPASDAVPVSVTTEDGSGSAALPDLVPGTRYSLRESPTDGWAPSSPLSCTATPPGGTATVIPDLSDFAVAPGAVLDCTAANTSLGTVVVQKAVFGIPDDRTFAFTSDIPGHEAFDVVADPAQSAPGEVVLAAVPAGEYTITELTDVQAPATVLAELVCDGIAIDPTDRAAAITVRPAETVECLFTNAAPGTILVRKQTLPADYPEQFDFSFQPDGAAPTPFALSGDTEGGSERAFTGLSAGRYTVAEGEAPPGWNLSDAVCEGDDVDWAADLDEGRVSIDLPSGGVIACAFTNAAAPAEVTLTKSVDGLPAGTAWSFALSLTPGAEPSSTQRVSGTAPASGTVTWSALIPGVVYTLAEEASAGWTAGAITCAGHEDAAETPGFQFTAVPGLELACEMTNSVDPEIGRVTTAKTVVDGPESLGDSRWRIAYRIDVTASGQAEATYELTDRLLFGEGIVVERVDITPPLGVTIVDGWDGVGNVTVVSDATIEAGAMHSYTVTVIAAVDGSAPPEALLCGRADEAGGLRNSAQAFVAGVGNEATACADVPIDDAAGLIAQTGGVVPPWAPWGILLLIAGSSLVVWTAVRRRHRG